MGPPRNAAGSRGGCSASTRATCGAPTAPCAPGVCWVASPAGGAAFLVRQPGQWPGERLGAPIRQGVTHRGTVSAPALRGEAPCSGEALPLRRLPRARKEPTRDGDTALPLRTHVPAQDARAKPLGGGEGKRWTLATALVALTTTRSCAMRTRGSPHAACGALCLALGASNAGLNAA